jgi:tetratricopeptide (TPR) repeat protein
MLAGVARPAMTLLFGPPGAVVGAASETAAASGSRALEQAAGRRQPLPGLLRISRRGTAPVVADVADPIGLGVHPAAPGGGGVAGFGRVPVFVGRDVMPEAEAVLSGGQGFLLLVGDSTAGKTRLAYEVVRKHFPRYRLVVPDSREAMVALVDTVARLGRAVVWLDDLEHYLGAGGLTAGQMQRMLDAGTARVAVVATMSARQHIRFGARSAADDEPGGDVLRTGREVLRLASVVRVDRTWSDAELARAQRHTHDPRIGAAVNGARSGRRGVAEYLAAAPQLLDDFRNAWATGARPRAAAMVAGAVDARRAGYHQPLPEDVLRRLHEIHLALRGGAALRPEPWEDALRWATEPLHATSSLLLPRDDNAYLAFDYLHQTLDEQMPPPRIPDPVWEILIDHADPARALDIGTTAYQRGDLHHAMAAFDRAGAGPGQLPRQSYATCVGEAGDPRRAADLYRELVEEAGRRGGPDARDTLENRNSHARYVGMAGHPAEAVDLLRGVIEDRTRVLGPEHSHTLNSRNNLALFLGETGRLDEAVAEYQSVLADRTRLLGADHPHTLSSRYGYAYLLGDAGRPGQAARLFDSLVADRTRAQGPYHPYTLNNRRHHAHFLGEAGHAARAAGLFEELVQDCLKVLDPLHPDTLAARHGRARFLGEAGDPARAAALLSDLIADGRGAAVHGPDSPIPLLWRRYQAAFLSEAGATQEAVRLLDALLAESGEILDAGHPQLFAVRAARARCIRRAGRVPEALALYERLVEDCHDRLGDDHPQTLTARGGRARCLVATGRPGEAAGLLEILVQDRTRVLGDDHPSTLNSRNAHACSVGLAGDRARAARLLRQVLQDRVRHLGDDHPWITRTREELARFQ